MEFKFNVPVMIHGDTIKNILAEDLTRLKNMKRGCRRIILFCDSSAVSYLGHNSTAGDTPFVYLRLCH